jgi:protein tyrosine phosphatase (PTP) superfamily phosphohydrolase (DUF442 family)
MYLFKHVKIEKDTIILGRPTEEDLKHLSLQGYEKVLDIMPGALKDKGLARRVRTAGMNYTHIPVEICGPESCRIDEDWVVRFFRYLLRYAHTPLIINTDDETLGITLVVLAGLFPKNESYRRVFQAVESLGFSLKGRKEIKHFVQDFYKHYQKRLPQ